MLDSVDVNESVVDEDGGNLLAKDVSKMVAPLATSETQSQSSGESKTGSSVRALEDCDEQNSQRTDTSDCITLVTDSARDEVSAAAASGTH